MHQHFYKAILTVCFCLLLISCKDQHKSSFVQLSGPTMGTQYHLTIELPTHLQAKRIHESIKSVLDLINQDMSTYVSDSLLSHINRAEPGEWLPITMEFAQVIDTALKVSAETQGAFDITVGPLVNLWGFGPGRENKGENTIPTDQEINELLKQVGYQVIELDRKKSDIRKLQDRYIDLSAIAKGYAVDEVARYFDRIGIKNYLIEIGGEIKVSGHRPDGGFWRVAIEAPLSMQRSVQKTVYLNKAVAVATSGDYRNYFEKEGKRYSHTIDPKTGRPITHALASVTVIADSSAIADALATALMVMGPTQGLAYANEKNLAVLFIIKDSAGFKEVVTNTFQPYLVGSQETTAR